MSDGGEIEPEDFADVTDDNLCVEGFTGKDYGSVGLLGVTSRDGWRGEDRYERIPGEVA